MKLTGIVAAFIDVPAEHTRAYNTWYDFEYMPEYAALPGFLGGRRYVATPECKATRPANVMPELAGGKGTYLTLYLMSAEDPPKAIEGFHALSASLRQQRRLFRHGAVAERGFYRLDRAVARKGNPLSAQAIPLAGHRGVHAVLTRVPDAAAREAVNNWWAEVHAQDLTSVPGVLAALRFTRFDPPGDGRYLNLYLLDGDPAAVAAEIGRRSPTWRAQGRGSPGGASQPVFGSPYLRIVPGEYDFRIE